MVNTQHIIGLFGNSNTLCSFFACYIEINVTYRFSSILKSTRDIFKFIKLRSLLEIAQNILIVQQLGQ